jgi:hypothetical protein
MQRQRLQRQLGNAAPATCPREDRHDAMYAVSRDRVCGDCTPLLSVQRNRAALERWAKGDGAAGEGTGQAARKSATSKQASYSLPSAAQLGSREIARHAI